jgi:hypothetical protein
MYIMPEKDRRDYIRMEVESDISYSVNGGAVIARGRGKNISHTGIQFLTGRRLDCGDRLDATLHSGNDLFRPLHMEIVVIRCEEIGPGEYLVAGELSRIT